MYMRRGLQLPIQRQLLRFSAAAFLLCVQLFAFAKAFPQTIRPQEDLHGVLSRQPLKPPLRNAEVTLRYSPDGRSLMVQNPSGIYLVSREPLALRAHIAAENVYPARFSFDSQAITVIGHGLALNRERVPGGPRLEQTELPFHDGCLDAELSPGADFFACLMPDFKLIVYQLSAHAVIFSDFLDTSIVPSNIILIPLDPGTALSGPFGFRLANDGESLAGKGMNFLPLNFSPDAKTLLVKNNSEIFSVDLATHQRTLLPGALHKLLHGSFCLQNGENVLIDAGEEKTGPAIASLKTGKVLATLPFKAAKARLASNSRYVLLSDDGIAGDRVFDLEETRELHVPDNLSIDIFGSEMAVLNEKGSLFLYHMGEILPFLSADLPLDSLPVLRAAAVSPSLDRFAFSVDGNGAVFQTATGELISSVPRFSAAIFSDQYSAYLLLPSRLDSPSRVVQLNLQSNKSAPAWSGGKGQLHSGGTVLLEYTMENTTGHRFVVNQANDIPYRLRALDSATGKELWKREFLEDSPVSFADPQGERLVLAWNGNSPGAEEAAKRIPAVWGNFKKAKPTILDTYFEVVDARSGQSVGGVLVQQGSGPYRFDAAFSVGEALFLVKDGKRVSVRSLQDGSLKAQFVGGMPAANAQSNLFALEEGSGRLILYDLATAAKLGQHIFPDSIAYTHFSADGNRLLVLTKHQVAYILDVSSLRQTPAPASAPH